MAGHFIERKKYKSLKPAEAGGGEDNPNLTPELSDKYSPVFRQLSSVYLGGWKPLLGSFLTL